MLQAMRNHWKKIAIASLPAYYAINELRNNYCVNVHMRMLCSKIEGWKSTHPPKEILVVLNPVCNKKQCDKLFRKYCEPILHLSGYFVNIVRTECIGHAKKIVESLDHLPDVIVIAGGDGTSSEVVTGLMRRNDVPCPVVLLPLGEKSETAFKYLNYKPTSKLEYLKCLSNSLMPLLNNQLRSINLIEYHVTDRFNSKLHKPVYGLQKFSWGLLKDIDMEKGKYWYLGIFKHYAAAIVNRFFNTTHWTVGAQLVYTPKCSQCTEQFTFTKTLNTCQICKTCKEKTENVQINQIDIICNATSEMNSNLEASITKSLNSGLNFIKIVAHIVNQSVQPSEILKMQSININPTTVFESGAYYIDGEEYDVRPIKLSVIPKGIKIFC